MSCERWNPEWIAHLYDEAEPGLERELRTHLLECEACRETMDGLQSTRQQLAGAMPPVPATPSLVGLHPRRRVPGLLSFVAGAACALVLVIAGFGLGHRSGPPGEADELAGLLESQQRLQERIALLEGSAGDRNRLAGSDGTLPGSYVTHRELEELLIHDRRRIEAERARDIQFVVDELMHNEARTDRMLGETQQALRMIYYKDDPRITQH